MLQLVIMLS